MRRPVNLFILVSVLCISALSSISAQLAVETEEYYRLRHLTLAGPPRYVKMVKISNMASGKSVISEGILFSYKSRKAKDVKIAGNFSNWRVQPMDRSDNGVWYYLMDNEGGADLVRYKFCVDGTWIHDRNNPDLTDDSAGSYLSLVEPYPRKEGKQVSYRYLMDGRVEFRIFRPVAKSISLVGDFNHWNPEQDLLRKGKDGIWRLSKKLHAGQYRYRYLIDGDSLPDTYNPHSSSDDAGDLCSLIQIK